MTLPPLLPPLPEPPAPAGRRTSLRVVLLHTVTFRQARQVVPVALAVAAGTGLGRGPSLLVTLVVVVTAASLAGAALTWWRTTYAVEPGSVVLTRGLLARAVRTVPLDRVRGVEVEAPPLHRLLGLVRVRVDAAAGSVGRDDEELVVDGVTPAEGDRLRAVLLGRRRVSGLPGEEPAEEEIARFQDRWLLYAPLVGSYLAVPLAAVGALFRLVDELPDSVVRDRLPGPDNLERIGAGVLASAAAVAALVLVVGAVVGSAVVNWRFRLVQRGGSLLASRGLLTRRHTELEIDRIRGCTVSEGLGMRLVRAARAAALVTGLGQAARRGQLLPLGPRTRAWELAHRLVEDPGPLRRHPPAARRRRLVRATLPGLLVAVAGAVLTATLGLWPVLAAGLVLAVLGVPLGLDRYAALGHAAGPRSFSVRAGGLVREQAVLQRRAVVGWQVRQTFFQRRAGLATAVACVGAGAGGYAAEDMAAADVAAFARAASGRWADTLDPAPPAPLPAPAPAR